MTTSRGGRVPESVHRSTVSVVAAWDPPARKMAKGSLPFIDEASKHTGASSTPKPGGKRVFTLAAVRQQKELTVDLSSRKNVIRCPRPGESKSSMERPIAFPRRAGAGRPVAVGSTIR